ncbi:histone acetyltransferase [Robbsia andropogonis]|uniref:Histone acetyltransferase n=1 Tax=Robbsia andropogonis TaxID=28092 RepID=A0A0F5JUC9_9BURK|nr:GNAT family N-acetyltransferase [Robbsia andropogonis]KKB61255.1 histone acetyltransferase [Robbsia andropogonis]MCP1120886.1 GNAT family N-acetyltransferase [Robbsia andropogonis]MCP1130652.1 GNAT family N-acetyltransferase [Robbsia andropogonis]
MYIKQGDFNDPQVLGILRLHLQGMYANSPPDSVSALDLSGLTRPDISFFTAWEEAALLGCGALRELTSSHGEIKSMRTLPAHVRKGVASYMLDHLLSIARTRNYTRVSLETGSGDAFEPAIMLYSRHGFVKGERFGSYAQTGFNQFFHLDLGTT